MVAVPAVRAGGQLVVAVLRTFLLVWSVIGDGWSGRNVLPFLQASLINENVITSSVDIVNDRHGGRRQSERAYGTSLITVWMDLYISSGTSARCRAVGGRSCRPVDRQHGMAGGRWSVGGVACCPRVTAYGDDVM